MSNSQNKSYFFANIERGIAAKILTYNSDQTKITYHCSRDFTTNIKRPEEIVRASYFAELVLDYLYPINKIDIEVKVERRIPDDRADIIVYEDNELKSPFIVIECKRDGISNAEFRQAIEQAFGNANSKRAKYAAVIAGTTIAAFDVAGFKSSEREKNAVADIPIKYGKAPKYKYLKGDSKSDLQIVNREELIKALEKCHDTVWQGGKLTPTAAFDEVSKLLFCKLKDEKYMKKGGFYEFQIGTHETAVEVSDRVNAIYQRAKIEDEEVFKEDIKLEPKIVYAVVEHLQKLAINKIDLDTKGVAFERFMQDFFRGKMGQFFTPRLIVDFNIQMLDPQIGEFVLDPSCGSGGFLLSCLDYIRHYCEKNFDEVQARELWHDYAKTRLYGIEINDQIARVCKMNMIIHDDGHTNVISADALSPFASIKRINKRFTPNSYDVIPANPPFGAQVRKAEKDDGYLQQYVLGRDKQNQKTEILFIERCIEFLKPGTGRMGIVLPDGILTNKGLQYVRDELLAKCELQAVVSLPQFAFTHFGAGVKSSLVFCRRKAENEILADDYPVFMAIANSVGYDAAGRDSKANDLPTIVQHYFRYLKNKKWLNIDGKFNGKIFVINRNLLQHRIDPLFFSTDISALISSSKFPKKALGEIVDYIKSGFAAGKKNQDEDEVGVIQIRPTNIGSGGELIFDKNIYISPEKIKPADYLQKGEVLFNNTNSQELVGKTTFFNLDGDYVCSNHITRIKPGVELLPEYLTILLNLYQRKKLFFNICTNWNNQSGVNSTLLKSVEIPLPSIREQRKIVDLWQVKNELKKKKEIEAMQILEAMNNEIENSILN